MRTEEIWIFNNRKTSEYIIQYQSVRYILLESKDCSIFNMEN